MIFYKFITIIKIFYIFVFLCYVNIHVKRYSKNKLWYIVIEQNLNAGLLSLPKNDVVVISLHSDFVHTSLKRAIQHRVSSLQFILRRVILCIQKTLFVIEAQHTAFSSSVCFSFKQ